MHENDLRFKGLGELDNTSGTAVLIGSAPSVRYFDFKNFDGLRIGIGDMPWRAPEFGPYDYWVCANSQYPLPWIKSHAKSIQKSNTKNLILGTVAFAELDYSETDKAIKQLKRQNNLPAISIYDQRHHHGQLCTPLRGCCFAYQICEIGETIQEMLGNGTENREDRYSGTSSVAFHGLALAIASGSDPIYIAGIDFPTRRRDYRYIHHNKLMLCKSQPRILTALNRKRESLFTRNSIWFDLEEENISDLQVLVKIASNLGISIVNTSPTSLLTKIVGIRSV